MILAVQIRVKMKENVWTWETESCTVSAKMDSAEIFVS